MLFTRNLYVGGAVPLRGGESRDFVLPADHLCTHGMLVGMTGSGKTGFSFTIVESLLAAEIPVILIDIKGDLPNLLLSFPSFHADHLRPWVDAEGLDDPTAYALAEKAARERAEGLQRWRLGEADVRRFHAGVQMRVLTPGSTQGEPMHLLSSLERRSRLWGTNEEAASEALSAAVSLVLRLLGRDPDPAKSRDHVLLTVLAERLLRNGEDATLDVLLNQVKEPPIETIGAQPIDDFMDGKERRSLAAGLNTLLASPSFRSWRQGSSLDVGEWLRPKDGKTQAVIISVAHLDDAERTLVLGVIFEEILAYTRGLGGTNRLRAVVVLDEVYGLVPPHPANPPTKRPIVTLMKQARAFGVGMLLSTQNPMDVDYRTLSNAGFWAVGRLQTDADRARVVESLANVNEPGCSPKELDATISKLAKRWFFVRNVHASPNCQLVHPRWVLSYMRGPMTLEDIRRAVRDPAVR
jgi:hypothetical protein